MKATGIVRRIDELGRIVIPKEIRKSLHMVEGENIEIYIENDNIILKKFSIIKNMDDLAQKICDVVYSNIKKNIVITDNNYIIAAAGEIKKDYLNQELSKEMKENIKRREKLLEKYDKDLEIISGECIISKYVINSIITSGDAVGLVIIFDSSEISEVDMKISGILTNFIGKYLEI